VSLKPGRSPSSSTTIRTSSETQRQRIIVYLSLDPTSWQPWNEEVMRDTTDIGHYGMGDLEYSLRASDQLDEVRVLAKAAYEAN
jgi:predicted transport protein